MYLKSDGVSVTPNDTSNGPKQQTFNATGHWMRLANGNGAMSGSDTIYTSGSHRMEASANITVGTVHKSTTDRHFVTLIVIPVM